jgi:hypothetical protein
MTQIRQKRLMRNVPAFVLLAALAPLVPALAQPPKAKAPEPRKPRKLTVGPAAAPVPALKYRLISSAADRNPGDAAPIYLRIRFQANKEQEAAWGRIDYKAMLAWLNLPLDRFPAAEVRKFVDLWADQLKQIEFGARRKTCDWNYSLPEQRQNAVHLDLHDANSMREWGALLALKARVEIAEVKFDDAVRTIETGLAFARHVAEGPGVVFMINFLHGAGISRLMLDRCDELISHPGAPNLYWALTALPRPLVSARDALEFDRKLCENLIPELTEAELTRPRSAAEWSSFLARMHEGIVSWSRKLWTGDFANDAHHPLKIMGGTDLAGFKARVIPTARQAIATSHKLNGPQLDAMPADQIVALYLGEGYHAIWDELFKGSYLPGRDSLSELGAAEVRTHADKESPLTFFVQMQPAVRSIVISEVEIDRHVAILRVIEALRMHAVHASALPESLSEVTECSVPDDPATGKPFEYHRDGGAATLAGLRADMPSWWASYRLTIRR